MVCLQLPPSRAALVSLCGNLLAIAVMAGCGAKYSAPPTFESSDRDAIKSNLTSLGARVTSDSADGLYLSFRNTFIEIRDSGGMVEGSYTTQQNVKDFTNVNDAIAKVLLAADDYDQFKKWLRSSLSGGSRAPRQAEYNRLKLTLSRVPLHMVFSLTHQP